MLLPIFFMYAFVLTNVTRKNCFASVSTEWVSYRLGIELSWYFWSMSLYQRTCFVGRITYPQAKPVISHFSLFSDNMLCTSIALVLSCAIAQSAYVNVLPRPTQSFLQQITPGFQFSGPNTGFAKVVLPGLPAQRLPVAGFG